MNPFLSRLLQLSAAAGAALGASCTNIEDPAAFGVQNGGFGYPNPSGGQGSPQGGGYQQPGAYPQQAYGQPQYPTQQAPSPYTGQPPYQAPPQPGGGYPTNPPQTNQPPAPAPGPPLTNPPAYTGGGRSYTVQSGDTLWRISQQQGTTVTAIQAANGLTTDQIYPGDVIRIP